MIVLSILNVIIVTNFCQNLRNQQSIKILSNLLMTSISRYGQFILYTVRAITIYRV